MTGAESPQAVSWAPHLILAVAAIAWFALVVPVAAWLETRKQRGMVKEVRPAATAAEPEIDGGPR